MRLLLIGTARSNCITPQQPLSTSIKDIQK